MTRKKLRERVSDRGRRESRDPSPYFATPGKELMVSLKQAELTLTDLDRLKRTKGSAHASEREAVAHRHGLQVVVTGIRAELRRRYEYAE